MVADTRYERELLQHLIDTLQALAPLIQRLHVTAHQQESDAKLALHVTARALDMLEQLKPTTGVRS